MLLRRKNCPSPSVTGNNLDTTGKHLKRVQLGLQARSSFCEMGFVSFPWIKLATNVKHVVEGDEFFIFQNSWPISHYSCFKKKKVGENI